LGVIIINQYLLTCKLNSKDAYYKASTKKHTKYKNSTNTQTLNKQTKRQSKELNGYVKSLGQKHLHSEEIQIS
jgi:hypothetical protein